MTQINLTALELGFGAALPELTALDGEGARIPFNAQDTKILILIENSSTTGSVTFKAGSGIQAVEDLTVEIEGGKTMAFVLESGRYKRQGAVTVTGPATMKAGALLLP